ncbi:hypothetical protein XA68_10623 [Ophiocordyceps unilateralis]|uniref:Uncharacterized protein n=1 Tax=Ophiocordyceps unilateralis TaxID=268505 RepID=A0A2A9NYN2_OPHUN|nr:hypothetical protein XA68_10623 [Ophiocordyceps unilateralis]
MAPSPTLTMDYQMAGTWGPVVATVDIFPVSMTTSEWLYHCGPVPNRITKRPGQLIMTSNISADDPLELDQSDVDWGFYLLSLLPDELRDQDLGRQEREEIRNNINLETGDTKLVARLNHLVAWLWDQRQARKHVCWPKEDPMRFVHGLASYTDGVANLFASDMSMEKAHSGWNAVPWTIDAVSLTTVHCLHRSVKFFNDIAIVLAKSTITKNWQHGRARIESIREFLIKHHDPFLKAVAAAVKATYRCSDGDRCRKHLLFGAAYLPRSHEDLIQRIRTAIGAGLPVCLKKGRVSMSNNHVYIDMGLA